MEEATRGARRAAEQRRAALVRSQELLLEHLTPEQRDTFHKNKWFLVIGGKTKTQYRIRTESYAGTSTSRSRQGDRAPLRPLL